MCHCRGSTASEIQNFILNSYILRGGECLKYVARIYKYKLHFTYSLQSNTDVVIY